MEKKIVKEKVEAILPLLEGLTRQEISDITRLIRDLADAHCKFNSRGTKDEASEPPQ